MNIIVKHFNELTNLELYNLLKIRQEVFIVEQNCVYNDIDDKDLDAYFVFIKDNDKYEGMVRVLKKGVTFDCESIGRVLTISRNKGYGLILMKKGIEVAIEKYNSKKIKIEAQSYARAFYEKLGFVKTSDEFLEDNIPHIEMTLEIE